MRTCLTLITLFISFSTFAAEAPDGAPLDANFHSCKNLDCSVYPSTKFHLEEKALSGSTVNGETFFATAESDTYKTIFRPVHIRYVFNPANGNIYEPGIDYVVTKEGIKLTPNSKIERAPKDFINNITPQEKELYKVRVTPEYQKYQYAITYDKNSKFQPTTFGSLGKFPSSEGATPLNITFFGDSITQGANATDTYTTPNQPGYSGLVMAYLNTQSPGMWESRNTSVGGFDTLHAIPTVSYRVMDKPSDLIVIGFGMNDSTGMSSAKYKSNLQKLITAIRTTQPKAPLLLVSSTLANPDSSIQNQALTLSYLKVLKELTSENEYVAAVDVTSTWQMMLKNKSYYDLTGNGLNHPNDFGHRVIAEAVLSAILGKGY